MNGKGWCGGVPRVGASGVPSSTIRELSWCRGCTRLRRRPSAVGRRRCGPRFLSIAQSRRSVRRWLTRSRGLQAAAPPKSRWPSGGRRWPRMPLAWRPSATRWARTGRSGSTPTEAGAWMKRYMRFGNWLASIWSTSSSRAPASTNWPICGAGCRDLDARTNCRR